MDSNWIFEQGHTHGSPQFEWQLESGSQHGSPALNLVSPVGHTHNGGQYTDWGQGSQQQQHQQFQMPEGKDWSEIPDLGDIEIQFFPDGEQQQHTQDPQQQLQHIQQRHQQQQQQQRDQQHQQTPRENNAVPPTPSSFEVAQNYHHDDFMETFDSPVVEHTGSVRPDVVFTPLVSPAVTPMDSMMQSTKQAGFFSPLTSPALEAKSPRRLKKQPVEEKKKYKRKTPGSTPIVGPTIPGRVTKQSPVIKPRRSGSYTAALTQQQQKGQQPQQQTQTETYPQDFSPVLESSMAPPKTRTRATSGVQQATPATPATLMNFKTGNSQSPVFPPSDDVPSRRTSISRQPRQPADEDEDGDPSSKKQSHKLAEQGRRMRMNKAILDLGYLIPESLQVTEAIPSKATTVEIATQYIRSLTNEVAVLRERLRSQGSDISTESISPLETMPNH